MSRIRGLELLYNLEHGRFNSKDDCLVAALHCLLIKNDLRCVGIGDYDDQQNPDTAPSEMLPRGWNDNQEVYTLRYSGLGATGNYMVKLVKAGHMLLVNVLRGKSEMASLSLDASCYVQDAFNKSYEDAYTDLDRLSNDFQKEIWDRLHVVDTEKKTKKEPSVSMPRPVGGIPASHVPSRPPMGILGEDYNPPRIPSVGGRDLDPFGRGIGGMLMDPSQFGQPSRPDQIPYGPGGLPRGSVPPGARFDPFSPPIRGPNRGFRDPDGEHQFDFI